MKLYQIIMKVPDNFVPDEMQMTAISPAGTVEICTEGFIGPLNFIECEETAPEAADDEVVAESSCEEAKESVETENETTEEAEEYVEETASEEDVEALEEETSEETSETDPE